MHESQKSATDKGLQESRKTIDREFDSDLELVVRAWGRLGPDIRQKVLAMLPPEEDGE